MRALSIERGALLIGSIVNAFVVYRLNLHTFFGSTIVTADLKIVLDG